jgi:hypothetical protein
MDVSLTIRQRLKELDLEQRGLAAAAHVTESYVSQLLARKKAPPAPRRTDIYERMEAYLKFPPGELARIAGAQLQEELNARLAADVPSPLFPVFRRLVLRKCALASRARVRVIVEREPFGELERLVGQKLLDVARVVTVEHTAGDRAASRKWLRLTALLLKCSYEQVRAKVRKLTTTEVFSLCADSSVPLLDILIAAWDIDPQTFAIDIMLNRKLAPDCRKRFEFVETKPLRNVDPGLQEFLRDKSLSGDATGEEIEFLKTLKLTNRQPSAMYYYRELQNLRDPVNFRDFAQSRDRH